MGLRKDFLEHKKNTVESFNSVSNDISNLHVHFNNLKSVLDSVESRLISVENSLTNVRLAVDKCISDVNLQKSNDLIVESTIKDLNNSVTEMKNDLKTAEKKIVDNAGAYGGRFKALASANRKLSKKTTLNSNLVKKLVPRTKNLSLKARKLGSGLRISQEESRKLRNLLNRKLRTIKRADLELEARFKSQKRRMVQLNRKIELSAAGRSVRRTTRRAARRTSKRIVTRKITPKKTVTTIKTPKRTITKTVTPKRTVTKKVTPKTKEIYEVIREKKPLI